MIKFISERVLTKLGLMQVATILSIIVAMAVGILLIHHQTDDYFTPLPMYLSSFKVAIPPLVLFVISYASAFVTGTPISDVPKAIIGFTRNAFMQSMTMMSVAIIVSVGVSAFSVNFLLTSTPPAYDKLVELLLGGSSDELSLVRAKIDEIKKTNPVFAMHVTKVTDVFAERNAINAGQKVLSGERVRTLVRSLEADTERDWVEHPLRKHALAEAYSLFGQSSANASFTVALDSARNGDGQFRRAINLYEQVSQLNDPLAPASLRMSARVNMGNAHFYMADYAGALKAWRAAAYGDSGQPNLSPWSNVIAALVMLDRPEEAVTEGERARTWAESSGKAFTETYQFAGVLGNMALAKLQIDDVNGAVADLATANAFRDDDLTEQNLALALIAADRSADSQRILRKLAAPASLGSPGDEKVTRCVYLIWALSMRGEPHDIQAANFSAFLGERLSAQELKNMSDKQFTSLVQRASAMLPKAQQPCNTLVKIKRVASLFEIK